MMRMNQRAVLIAVCGALAFSAFALNGLAHVRGEHGIAPDLPPDIPGLERPFPQDNQKFTFAVIGDKTGGGLENWPIFDRTMREVNELRPDFAIMVGDLIQGGTVSVPQLDKEWKEFLEHANLMEAPFFFLPGNHDIGNRVMYDYWERNVGRTYYSFNYKNCHFMTLNTEEGWRSGEVMFGERQLKWAEENIEKNRGAKHLFLFMHRPAWRHTGEALAQWERIEERLKGTRYTVFVGHYHRLSYEPRRGRPYFILGPTGGALLPSEAEEYGAIHHYALVTVDGSETRVAIIRPGSVFPHDIATPEFRALADKAVRLEPNKELNALKVSVENPFKKALQARVSIGAGEEKDASISFTLEPGESGAGVLQYPRPSNPAQPALVTVEVAYDGEQLYQRIGEIK